MGLAKAFKRQGGVQRQDVDLPIIAAAWPDKIRVNGPAWPASHNYLSHHHRCHSLYSKHQKGDRLVATLHESTHPGLAYQRF